MGCDWAGIELGGVSATVEDNRLAACGMDGIALLRGGPCILLSNEVTDCIGTGVRAEDCVLTMAGNRITANGDGGVRIITRDAPARAARLESNVIAANNAVGVALNNAAHLLLIIPSPPTSGRDSHSRAGAAGKQPDRLQTAPASAAGSTERAGNNIFGNFFGEAPESSPAPGDISADPLLAGTRYGDFHIQPQSPCVGAGSGMYELAYPDVDGQFRISGASVDIGADESYGEDRTVTPRIIRVSASSTAGVRDGASWDTAYASLEEAMRDCAVNGPAQVWLAQGTYPPEVRLLLFATYTAASGETRHP